MYATQVEIILNLPNLNQFDVLCRPVKYKILKRVNKKVYLVKILALDAKLGCESSSIAPH